MKQTTYYSRELGRNVTIPERLSDAEQIAEMFGGDGEEFDNAAGDEIVDVCERRAVRILNRKAGRVDDGGISDAATRYEFDDNSSVVTIENGWDLGFPGEDRKCFCWASNPGHPYFPGHHEDNCPSGAGDPFDA